MTRYTCKICESPDGKIWTASERMFGMGGSFPYFECSGCGCVQLAEVPENLGQFYPSDRYYSLESASELTEPKDRSRLPEWLRLLKNRYFFFGGPIWLSPFGRLAPPATTERVLSLLKHVPVQTFDAKILDVGCGRGDQLVELAAFGFRNLHGVDPFLKSTTNPAPGITLHKSDLAALADRGFNLIMMNHSLEHLPDQVKALTEAGSRLAAGGVLRIEIPVADSEAWRQYGVDWVDLDAPRHLFVHTRQSLRIVAKSAGLEVFEEKSESDAFEFWVSDAYKSGKFLYDAEGRMRTEMTDLDDLQREHYRARARAANSADSGARRLFRLRRAAGPAAGPQFGEGLTHSPTSEL